MKRANDQFHSNRICGLLARTGCLFAGMAALFAGIGCSGDVATTQPSGSVRDRQDAALKDPFSYGPTQPDPKKGTPEKSKPDGSLKSDWDRFWNP